jgi:hypothetical protein
VTLWAALVLGCAALLAVGTTFLPGAPFVPEGIVMTLFVLVFPVFGAALVRDVVPMGRVRSRQRASSVRGMFQSSAADRRAMRVLWSTVPTSVKVTFVSVLFAMWLAGMSSFSGPRGQPTQEDGRYFLVNHGTITEVSEGDYDRAVTLGTRGFASGAVAFYAMAALLSEYGPIVGRLDDEQTPSR